jgi:hypothetical protein
MRLVFVAAAAAAAFLPFATLAVPGAAQAHHGWTGQEDKVTTLEGPIQKVSYRDPHGEIEVTSGGQKWLVTLAPIARMQARGLTEDQLKPGQTVWISGKRNVDRSKYELKAETIRIGAKSTDLLR